jgi:hypothetical protein
MTLRAGRAALAVVYYHNRSKRGSLELLRRWAERADASLLLLSNRETGEVDGLVDEQVAIDFTDLGSAADAIVAGVPVRAVPLECASRLGGAYMQSFWLEATGFDAVAFLAGQACGHPVAAAVRHLRPSIMLNLWPDGDGEPAAVEGVDAVRAAHPDLLREVVIYDRPGYGVLLSAGAERGTGAE